MSNVIYAKPKGGKTTLGGSMKLDLNRILNATSFVYESAEELGLKDTGELAHLLDELDALAMQKLEDEEEDE